MRIKKGISINGKRIDKYFKTNLEACVWKAKMILDHSDYTDEDVVWMRLKGFSKYQFSNTGLIRSMNYKRSGLIKHLQPAKSKDGYLQTMLQDDNGKYHSWKVHKFITLAFYGERPDGLQVNHKDGNKENNNVYNLEYCTPSENCQHSFDIGLQKAKSGELNGMSKLTKDQVLMIREAKKTKGRYWGRNEIAKQLGMSPKHLQNIANNNKLWPNVSV